MLCKISGAIDLALVGGSVSIRSNRTIKGTDPNATITGQPGFKKCSSNIMIERLNITNPGNYGEDDGISLKEDISDVFITKCTFYDCDDGCLDITRRSDRITVSWCKFYFTASNSSQSRVSIIGNSDNAAEGYYNQDDLVNGFEFALFAGNWLHTTADL